ncbi:putative SAM-dependent methyltransferase [Bernardetia litoralis DSM 6794]|uniref:Putative SAM-dependent methyltransferase n=1 Tax=Bernardetia litoralis (strain ATCC 23117 / DSM 6794 / NBRC 15988 / NCIMB 1366 / Fx l1 / Sio-4) TaxID=880071 RepID=I4AQX3_BERLS|nr:class I SAM-dependent rRNA methyltransferase [Bernardetia litoralis]AFM06358.1 putative SAM-dependent methyltransferase [Bernardetia litoralis DSM 6794]
MTSYPIVLLKKGREKSILNQHPWIFSGAVQKMPNLPNGEIVAVQDAGGRILGYGFFDPNSQITCRIFEFTRFHDKKTEFIADEAYFHQKIKNAYNLRENYLLNSSTNAYRLLHAEGDFFSGVIVDIYDTVASVQLLTKGTERIAKHIFSGIRAIGIEHIYLHIKESTKNIEGLGEDAIIKQGWQLEEGQTKNDIPLMPVQILENNLKFKVDVVNGQKTGFFIDQRENRELVKQYSKDKSVLNCFGYTGGFSVYAIDGGAKKVVSVDISKDATDEANQNVALNFNSLMRANNNHEAIAQDCFEYLKGLDTNLETNEEEQFDIIILDPPAFSKNKRSLPKASRGYINLNELGFKKVKSGGLVFTFSCSGSVSKDLFRKLVFTAAAEAGRKVRIVHQLTQPLDHPINIYHPEGEYLKGLVLQVE